MTVSSSRRSFCKAGAALAFGLASNASAYPSYEKASGSVIDVRTGRGIPNVRVSNGRDLVLSDRRGVYELPVRTGDTPFLIKPRDYRTLLDENHLPLISNHSNSGTDFFLEPCDENETIRVLLIADPQPGDDTELFYLSRYIERIRSTERYDAVVVLGDLVGDNFNLYSRYDQIMSRLGAPIWNVPGNHDVDLSCRTPMNAKKMWRDRYGPGSRAFEIGATSFIVLDNIGLRVEANGGLSYYGSIGDENLAFVKNYLKTLPIYQSIVLLTHIPLASSLNAVRDDCHTHDTLELLSLLADRNCVSFSGHMHAFEQHLIPFGKFYHNHRVLNALSGSWWSGPFARDGLPISQSCDGTPSGWYILEIDRGEIDLQFIQARNGEPYRINLVEILDGKKSLLDNVIQRDRLDASWFQINVFEGGPHTSVEVLLDEKMRLNVSHVFDVDLQTCDLFDQAGETLKSWVRPVESTHLWHVDMPSDLPCGSHQLLGRIIQGDQRVYEFRYSFYVA